MKITEGGNNMSVKICEINNYEYFQKLIYKEIMFKISSNIYTAQFLTSSSIKSSKNKHHEHIFKKSKL